MHCFPAVTMRLTVRNSNVPQMKLCLSPNHCKHGRLYLKILEV